MVPLASASLGPSLDNPAFRLRLEREVFPSYLPRCRWYRSKAQALIRVGIEAWTAIPSDADAIFSVIRVELEGGNTERYALPLGVFSGKEAKILPLEAALCRVRVGKKDFFLGDACYNPRFRRGLLAVISGGTIPLGTGFLRGKPSSSTHTLPTPLPELAPARGKGATRSGGKGATQGGAERESRVLGTEQSNTGMAFSSGSYLKLYRRLEEGIHPEPEMLRFLREQAKFRAVPEFQSVLEWERPGHAPVAVALWQTLVAGEGNAWEHALREISAAGFFPDRISDSFADWIRLLGRRTAEMHAALGSRPDLPDFSPEEFTDADFSRSRAGISERVTRTFDLLDAALPRLSSENAELARKVLAGPPVCPPAPQGGNGGMKIRVHGDFHLGQILCVGKDFRILDFEGETARAFAEKRRKHSPLRDVAGMLRSFHYAIHVAARTSKPNSARAENLQAKLSSLYLDAYFSAMANTQLLPENPGVRDALLHLFVLEKAVYELDYELNNRPDWVGIPLRGLLTPQPPLYAFKRGEGSGVRYFYSP